MSGPEGGAQNGQVVSHSFAFFGKCPKYEWPRRPVPKIDKSCRILLLFLESAQRYRAEIVAVSGCPNFRSFETTNSDGPPM